MAKIYNASDPLPFGKYKGLSIEAIARFDPAYLLWIKRSHEGFAWSEDALTLAKKAWSKNHYEKLERQNGWAWGFGNAVRRSAERSQAEACRIEAEERKKAGLL